MHTNSILKSNMERMNTNCENKKVLFPRLETLTIDKSLEMTKPHMYDINPKKTRNSHNSEISLLQSNDI